MEDMAGPRAPRAPAPSAGGLVVGVARSRGKAGKGAEAAEAAAPAAPPPPANPQDLKDDYKGWVMAQKSKWRLVGGARSHAAHAQLLHSDLPSAHTQSTCMQNQYPHANTSTTTYTPTTFALHMVHMLMHAGPPGAQAPQAGGSRSCQGVCHPGGCGPRGAHSRS